jgi:uncharacterized protein YcbX
MTDLGVDRLNVYPIKSLEGMSVSEVNVTSTGFEGDRTWCLVDGGGNCLTRREHSALARFSAEISAGLIRVRMGGETMEMPLAPTTGETVVASIWGDRVEAVRGPSEAANWFSKRLGVECTPVYIPDRSIRQVDPDFAPEGAGTAFTDGFPILVTTTSSLDDLNSRMEAPVPMSRFRPNLVIRGAEPFAEDHWARTRIGTAVIRGVKPCSRCVVTTIDPVSVQSSKEPLRTLSTFRRRGEKVYFGENFIVESEGTIRVGDAVRVESLRS